MKNRKSFKVMWNVFLFVICGGSLIYGFVQQRQTEKYQQQIDSLNVELEKMNEQLQIEKNLTQSALHEADRQKQKARN